MNLDWLITGLAALTLANYWFRRSVLYPPFLFCGMWLLDASIYRMGVVDLYSLHAITCVVVLSGAVLFSFGGVLAFFVPWTMVSKRITVFGPPRTSGRWMIWLVITLLVIGLLNNIRSAISLAGGITTANGVFWAVAGKAAVDEINANGGTVQVGNYIANWSVFLAVLLLAEEYSALGLLAAAIAFLSCVVSGGRGGLFLLASALIAIYLIKRRRESFVSALRSVRWAIIGFVTLFIFLFFVNKGVQANGGNVLIMARNILVQYIVGAIGALDHVLTHLGDYADVPNHTFQLLLKGMASLGLISYSPPPSLDEWVYVPFGTNVYTIYKPYIVDFGVAVGVGWMCLFGCAHTLLFRKAHTNSLLGLYMFALTVYSVFMVIFDDEYSRFGMYGSALIFGLAYLTVRSIHGQFFRSKEGVRVSGRSLPRVRLGKHFPVLRLWPTHRRPE